MYLTRIRTMLHRNIYRTQKKNTLENSKTFLKFETMCRI